jgi:hypothetical protein
MSQKAVSDLMGLGMADLGVHLGEFPVDAGVALFVEDGDGVLAEW